MVPARMGGLQAGGDAGHREARRKPPEETGSGMIKAALISQMLGDHSVFGIVGSRITPPPRPQGEIAPAIVVRTIVDLLPPIYRGRQELIASRVQIDCWATSAEQAVALGKAVLAALAQPFSAAGQRVEGSFVLAARDDGEAITNGYIHRRILDLRVWHKEQ